MAQMSPSGRKTGVLSHKLTAGGPNIDEKQSMDRFAACVKCK